MFLIKKDTAILCQYFYPEHVSSATLPTQLAQGLNQKGLSIEVFTGYPTEYLDDENRDLPTEIDGIPIHRVKYTTFNNKSKMGRLLNFFSFFVSMSRKILALKNFNKVIVYSNPPVLPLIPYIAKKVFGTEFIFVAFDIYPDNALKMNGIKPNGLIHKLMNFINKRIYSNAEEIVLLGNEMYDYVIQNNIAGKTSNLKVIPNWFTGDEEIIKGQIDNAEFRALKEQYKLIVLYSGNMGAFQDIDTILKGIRRFKNSNDILFVFSGHGKKTDEVKEFLETEGITNSRVYGFLKGQDYSDILAISNVCLVSLEKGIEGLGVPSKTYGYLAAGKSVISIMSHNTDIAQDLESWKCGHNILQGDVLGFEKVLSDYLSGARDTQSESRNARSLYKMKYQKDISLEKYFSILK
ncbi:glycosyltransferase family 4 protein [Planococcus sp. CP5-4]|uniref:glycosyltransferase family 4 protein n=1 Tax=unclassified Planococcus (in: firmicutes) TaxID=2662419 RepID=UPI001C21D858|nr:MULTISPECIES: glycosyltransferase family 4 protein [unclassified Planococcus (in: firmicutes)]MBU9675096.1 glycosyltransferase family 4 protein [Planococcus sp. CP5-4_YE]MBV0908055.1 glycosyltransferase family 4 protein [Planococcus sp. CP5-4_UN]MBW6062116.1 glycosyltransferase family 4 protein [Planococcus sp. CP5-4]